ncbi:3-oxo-5-alpha-steroid 4-dehydrogenase 2 [Pseudolycoriella hygida]|uniref:3-oxo-5-alpha-steroid 4-dehydrogenase 2 n=1 Tax=Pseudolycoriella hygida TaxID=35572 RepID=A0A9Q0NBU8_9DIPT|nr:3-oxo-5-alpha-steroid 4-dehydrogenase 2 [Pseudolycoriella hygida]
MARKECKDLAKPHQTRCDMYYKCVVLPSKNIAWVPTNCKRGLIYEINLKICVVPDANWECSLGDDINTPTKSDDNNVYGINNLDYLNKEIQSYRPKYDVNGDPISSDSEKDEDNEEEIVVVNSEKFDDIDENNIEVIDNYNLTTEVDANDEVDYSGDGSDDKNEDIVEKKETYIAIPLNSDPTKTVASHLERLSQLIQTLKDSQSNKSQSYEFVPSELNSFMSHHNIKAEYNDQLKHQKKKQNIPMDGRIRPDYLSEILELQQKLQSTTTQRTIELVKYPAKSTIQIKSPVRITDPGFSSSQIVVNRPEGSVLFSLPNNLQTGEPTYNSSPSPPLVLQQQQQEPYVSQDTLKTALELSKEIISSANQKQTIHNYIPESNYFQPVFRPVYYDIPVPIINNYEKKEPKHDESKDQKPLSEFKDTTPKYYQGNGGEKSDEYSTIIHNHIPIIFENPFQQSVQNITKVSPTAAPATLTTAAGGNHQFDDIRPPQPYSNVYNNRPYVAQLPEQQSSLNSYSNPYQYPQPNVQNFAQLGQPLQNQFYQDHQYPVNGYRQPIHTQETNFNNDNVNNLVNLNTQSYPTLQSASQASPATRDSIYSVTPKIEPFNIYQQELSTAELPITMEGFDDGNNEYDVSDGNGNEDYETNEEDNIAADMNEYNMMNLLADIQNRKIPNAQNKQLTESVPSLLIGANDDTKRKVVQFGDKFMSVDEYEKLVQPLINKDALSANIDVIPCVTGARQPLSKDCTKYIVCNGDTNKVLTYTCPPYTAFNKQSRYCDAKTFTNCKNDASNALDVIAENDRLKTQVNIKEELAHKKRIQALKAQQLSALIKQQVQEYFHSRPMATIKRPMRYHRKKIQTSIPQPFYRTRPTKKRKNKPMIRRIPCKEPSKVADSLSIYNYFSCYKGTDGVLKARKMTCPNGLVFCERIRLCTKLERTIGRHKNLPVIIRLQVHKQIPDHSKSHSTKMSSEMVASEGLQVLQGTLFSCVYSLFGVSGDEALMYRMTLCAIIYTIVVGLASVFIPAFYGKHSTGQTLFTMNARTAWMIQESPAFFVPIILIFQTPSTKLLESDGNKIALLLFTMHYFNRSFIYPFRITNSKPVPLLTCSLAFMFTFFNGLLQGFSLTNIHSVGTSSSTIAGATIFLTGMAINIYHDGILINLRKDKKNEGKSGYKIPRGGLYELISGANFFGEIVEWWGLYVITSGIPQLTFAVFSNAFLGLRAVHHHQWYIKTFGKSYPPERKAIIPYAF